MYAKLNTNGSTTSTNYEAQSNGELSLILPAPPPTVSNVSRAEWCTGQQAEEPVGHLLRAVHLIGGKLNHDFEILIHNEAPIGILDTPYQLLGKAVLAAAARARTKSLQVTKEMQQAPGGD